MISEGDGGFEIGESGRWRVVLVDMTWKDGMGWRLPVRGVDWTAMDWGGDTCRIDIFGGECEVLLWVYCCPVNLSALRWPADARVRSKPGRAGLGLLL